MYRCTVVGVLNLCSETTREKQKNKKDKDKDKDTNNIIRCLFVILLSFSVFVSKMIANSTNISNRMFRSQRIIILSILAAFLMLLGITSLSGHHQVVVNSVKSMSNKASDSISDFYNKVDPSLPSDEKELKEEGIADAERLAELADEKLKEIKEEDNTRAQQK